MQLHLHLPSSLKVPPQVTPIDALTLVAVGPAPPSPSPELHHTRPSNGGGARHRRFQSWPPPDDKSALLFAEQLFSTGMSLCGVGWGVPGWLCYRSEELREKWGVARYGLSTVEHIMYNPACLQLWRGGCSPTLLLWWLWRLKY
jgi:hypothetical protein